MRALIFMEVLLMVVVVIAMMFYVFKAIFGEWPWKYPPAGKDKNSNNQPNSQHE